MSKRSLTDFGSTTAGDQTVARDDGPSLDRSIFHDDASFDALLVELAEGVRTPAVPLPGAGEVIAGKYRIEEQLGQGGMAVVYRATHLISGKQVALKWMLSAWSDTRARTRFVREARAAARIDHRNVVDIYDIGQDGDRGLYMVMQLLRGESLAKRLARGRMGIQETIDSLLPAMRGVAAVHAAGVIHRDLKPDNIFLCEAPAGLCDDAKVLDFGISAMSAQEDADQTLTRDGAMVGTLAYMSPEQIQDSRAVDARTDVYAFGVILYEALTGQQPFRAAARNALVLAIIEGHPRDPREHRGEIPEALVRVVMRALSKNRADRFPDVRSLIDALGAPDLFDVSGQRVAPTRGRAARLAAGVMTGALVLVAGAWWWLTPRATRLEVAAVSEGIVASGVVALPALAPPTVRGADSPKTSEPHALAPAAAAIQPTPQSSGTPKGSNPSLQGPLPPLAAPPSRARRGSRPTKGAAHAITPQTTIKPNTSAVGAVTVPARSGRIVFEEL